MPPNLSPQEFVSRWKKVDLTEKASAQSHFIDLCALVGQPKPTDVDPTGDFYAFERGAIKSGGKKSGEQGWADVWKKGYFAWEYKRNKKNLDEAYNQLQLYREALENPPLLIVSDNLTIQVHTNFTNTVKKVYIFTLDDLLDAKKFDQFRKIWTDPETFRIPTTTAEVTEQVAREFANLSELLRKQQIEPGRAAHFLIRLLFCLFAEDIGLLPNSLFSRLVEATFMRPIAFAWQLKVLFEQMRTGGFFGSDVVPYFNGGLFDSEDVVELDAKGLDILLRVSRLDWSSIEPAVLGTLFERSLDPSKRGQLGAHYTSKDDILLIVEPVLMAPLRRRWVEVQQEALKLASGRDAATNTGQRTRLNNQLASKLTGFADEVGQVKVLDPACGSGNFLYVALKQLLDLQKEIITFAADMNLPRFFPSVGPHQLKGIEINEYAHELAQTTIWIGYIQWLRDNGFGQPDEPILKPIKSIMNMDAVLAYDKHGKPIEPQWPEADVIIGNPPFVGGNKIRQELGNQYVDNLFKLYEGRIPAFSDLVCYWFEKARMLIEADQIKRVGLIATQAIRGGVNRRVLEHIKQNGDIFMAWSDRNWILDGASVHVSLIGFDKGTEKERSLNGVSVKTINANLTGASDLTQAKHLIENEKLCFIGTKKAGAFDINAVFAKSLLDAPINPNGRPNSDVIFPWLNGEAIARRATQRWIIYFGDMGEEEAAFYEAPFEYVRKNIYPERQGNNEERARRKWWVHRRPAVEMREATLKLKRYIATPRVSKHRVFAWVPPITLPDDGIYVFARDDDYFFGVLHSKMHELWARGTGTQLREAESGFRYTPTSTFETFPFHWLPGKESTSDPLVEAISQAARELVAQRDAWLNPPGLTDEAELKKRTLTNLYNKRPTWLVNAHQKLDRAVLDAYGWPHDLTDEQILERLLALNLERAAAQGGLLPPLPTTDTSQTEMGLE